MNKKIKYTLLLISIIFAILISLFQITANNEQLEIDNYYSNYDLLKNAKSRFFEITQNIEFYNFLLENTDDKNNLLRLKNNSEVISRLRFEEMCDYSNFTKPIKEKYIPTENVDYRIKQLNNLSKYCFDKIEEERRALERKEADYISKKKNQEFLLKLALLFSLGLIIVQSINVFLEYKENKTNENTMKTIKKRVNSIHKIFQ